MGAFSWILLAIVTFVFLRQLPSHKLYVVVRDLQEAQTFFATQVEEGIMTGKYAEDYRTQLNELQVQTDALRKIMQNVWPFSPHDFFYMFRGVTKECYRLRDEVESLRNNIWRTSCHEKMRFDSYKSMPMRSLTTQYANDGYTTDATVSTLPSPLPSAATSPILSPIYSPSSPPPFSVGNGSILPIYHDRRFTNGVKTSCAF
ncbi:hypothetical protein FKP32DRAFT_1605787 [Trametes sanguinea]|nr:hypothetical protein FKP32DRAFT_1605787 [Trametes sanguinea]